MIHGEIQISQQFTGTRCNSMPRKLARNDAGVMKLAMEILYSAIGKKYPVMYRSTRLADYKLETRRRFNRNMKYIRSALFESTVDLMGYDIEKMRKKAMEHNMSELKRCLRTIDIQETIKNGFA